MNRKVVMITILMIGVFTIIGISLIHSSMRSIEGKLKRLADVPVTEVDLTNIFDGVYIGRYKEFPLNAEVVVTIRDQSIFSIKLTKHKSGQGAPAEAIIDRVLKSQSLKVDAIVGATYSSNVILKAIENALIPQER